MARWCRLLAAYGVAADPADLDLPAPPDPGPAPGAVVLHPGAAAGSRRWPAGRFAAVAAGLRRAGHPVVVTGSAAERAAGHRGRGPGRAAAGRRAGRPDRPARAGRAGRRRPPGGLRRHRPRAPGHRVPDAVGAAVRADPGRGWGPPADRPQHVVLRHGPGRRDPHGAAPDPALLAIGVPEVLAAAEARLDRKPAGTGGGRR